MTRVSRRRRSSAIRPSHDEPQPQLFGEPATDVDIDYDQVDAIGDLQRDVNRMRLETSSNVYAQRRSQW